MLIALTILGIVLGALYSAAEIAMITANKLQIKVWMEQKLPRSGMAYSVITNKEEFMTIILFGTNFFQVMATTTATLLLSSLNMPEWAIVLSIATTILLIAEIFPKTLTHGFANVSLLSLSPLLVATRFIFWPAIWLFTRLNKYTLPKDADPEPENPLDDRVDLREVYEQADNSESIEAEQKDMITNVLEIRDVDLFQAMTPRTDISALPADATIAECIDTFHNSGHSKLPVYDEDLDHVIGVVNIYDLFKTPNNLRDIIQDVSFIPGAKTLADTMREFLDSRKSIAMVLDEYGGTAGLVTIEDLFEELLGDFEDEFDMEEEDFLKMKDGSILVLGKMDWEEFNNHFGELIPDGDYETIAGFLLTELAYIPMVDESFDSSIGHVTIKEASPRAILKMQIRLKVNEET